MRSRDSFYAWGLAHLLAQYEKAMREGKGAVQITPNERGEITVMGVDLGEPGGDRTAVSALRGKNIDVIILDDPYADEARTFEGQFHEIAQPKLLCAPARSETKNRGPQPRTKYPRRR